MELTQLTLLLLLVLLATWSDLKAHRIPNWLTIGALVVALGIGAWWGGWSSLGTSALGAVVGLGILIPFYVIGWMGAGDVKLMAAVGALVGSGSVLIAAAFTLLAGAVVAVGLLLRHGELLRYLRRWMIIGSRLIRYGRLMYEPPAVGDAANLRYPYALAVAIGTFFALWYTGRLQPLMG